jgi:hypothetical protein
MTEQVWLFDKSDSSPYAESLLPPRRTRRKALAGLFLGRQSMPPSEPSTKRAVAFVDGQNLFFAAQEAFGQTYPDQEFPALAQPCATPTTES